MKKNKFKFKVYDSFFDLEKNNLKNFLRKLNNDNLKNSLIILNYASKKDVKIILNLAKKNFIKIVDIGISSNLNIKNNQNIFSLLN